LSDENRIALLAVRRLNAGYGKKPVVRDVAVTVEEHQIVALIGPNGAGKSTVLKAILGLLSGVEGEVLFRGKDLAGLAPAERISRGISFCAQGNRVFAELTVNENLRLAANVVGRRHEEELLQEAVAVFPRLGDRLGQKAGTLSGGEQQMVAVARAMMQRPKLMVLDEPSVGLSPQLASSLLGRIATAAKTGGMAVLIVEQKVRQVLEIADRAYGLRLGRVACQGDAARLAEDLDGLRCLFL